MTGAGLVLGTADLLFSTAAMYFAAWRLARKWSRAGGVVLIASTALLGAVGMVAELELLGTFSILSPISMALASGMWAGICYKITARCEAQRLDRLRLRRLEWIEVIPGLALFGLAALVAEALVISLDQPSTQFDTLAFHLPVAVEWLQSGTTWILPYEGPLSFPAHYPANSELMALWAILPVHRDFIAQMGSLPGVALLTTGTAMLARLLGAGWFASAAAVLASATLPNALSGLLFTNMEDVFTTGALVTAAAFAVRAWRNPSSSTFDLLCAGLAGGLGLGARYAALATTPYVLLLCAAPVLVRTRNLGSTLRSLGFLIAGLVFSGGYFYLRNLVFTGDPVYPEPYPGHPVHATERLVFPLVHSYASLGWAPDVWRQAAHDAIRYDGWVSFLIVAGAVIIAPVSAALRRERDILGWMWALAPLALLLEWLVMPGSLGYVIHGHPVPISQAISLRYGYAMIPIDAAILAGELGRLPRRVDLGVTAVWALAAGGVSAHLTSPAFHQDKFRLLGFALAIALIAFCLGLYCLRWFVSATILIGCAVGVSSVAPIDANHFDKQRLSVGLQYASLARSFPDPGPIAVAGICQLYPLYGPDLNRRVEYLTGDDNTINRPLGASYASWLSSLRSHRIVLLVVRNQGDVCYPFSNYIPEAEWAATHPAVFHLIHTASDAQVYSVVDP